MNGCTYVLVLQKRIRISRPRARQACQQAVIRRCDVIRIPPAFWHLLVQRCLDVVLERQWGLRGAVTSHSRAIFADQVLNQETSGLA